MKTIGIIGGVTWHSSAEYYRILNELVSARLGGQHSAKIVLFSLDFADHMEIQETGGWDAVIEEIVDAGRSLKKAGADFLMLGANTLHKIAPQVTEGVGLPVLHIADATGKIIVASGLKKVGLLGTKYTMGEPFFRQRLAERFGLEVIIPNTEDFEVVDSLIYNEVACGNFSSSVQQKCIAVMNNLKEAGAEGIILGCTELPKLVGDSFTGLPLFDTLAAHANAAVQLAFSDLDYSNE